MFLHENLEEFRNIVDRASASNGYKTSVVEKDYYVTLFLEKFSKNLPGLIFKGGTSLSKCYGVIKRFSEDIDITVEHENKLTEGQYRAIKKAVVRTAGELGLNILNLDKTRSRRDYNKYVIDYNPVYGSPELKQFLLIETSVAVRSFPTEQKEAKSIIQDYLEARGLDDKVKEFGLRSFSVRTQTLDRTLSDKLFAVGDYYIKKEEAGHSRHLYDIHKLVSLVKIDQDFNKLMDDVREVRKGNKYCYSAHEGVDLLNLLNEVLAKDAYKEDYEQKTLPLLLEDVPYAAVRKTLNETVQTLQVLKQGGLVKTSLRPVRKKC